MSLFPWSPEYLSESHLLPDPGPTGFPALAMVTLFQVLNKPGSSLAQRLHSAVPSNARLFQLSILANFFFFFFNLAVLDL